MPNYKDQNNQIHFLVSEDYEYLLSRDCIKITDLEADNIRKTHLVVPTYQELRAAKYPPMADYLDAVVKGDEAQKQAYIDACLAVKAEFPKV